MSIDMNAVVAQAVKDAVAKLPVTKGTRQAVPGNSGSDVTVTKENVSLFKYIHGVATKRWDNATTEHRMFKALNETFGTEGGFLVPIQISAEIVELLKAKAVVRSLVPAANIIPMQSNRFQMNRIESTASITWGGENRTIDEDASMTFGGISLELKKAVCLYTLSRELIRDGSPMVEATVREELAAALALAEDAAFLFGTGGNEPLGLFNHPGVLHTSANGAFSFDTISNLMNELEGHNSTLTGIVAGPTVKYTLSTLKDADGNYLYKSPITGNTAEAGNIGTLGNAQCRFTTVCPASGYTATNHGILFGGDFGQMLIGEPQNEGIRIESTDSGGDAFVKDQLKIKAVRRIDVALRHPQAFGYVTGIQK